MGCTASKLDGEDTVRRYKNRRRLMKESVYARHSLAAAQADYCRSLRLTGSALSSFAAGEPLSVSYQTPAVFLHHPPPPPSQPSPTNSNSIPPPPPPPPPIISASSSRRRRQQQHQQRPKLPHILSDSSPSSSPASERSNFYPRAYQNSTYSATPSHASSVWNWENFYPPSPPDSEFFDKKAQEEILKQRETERTEHASKKKKSVVDGDETEREEVQCGSWDVQDHYSTTSSSEEEVEDDNMESVSEVGRASQQHHDGAEKGRYDDKEDDATTYCGSYRGGGGGGGGDVAVRHRDLKEIADAIKEYFDKAAAAGDQVSQMLELGRAQLDGSFRQLKSELRSVYVLFFITWNQYVLKYRY